MAKPQQSVFRMRPFNRTLNYWKTLNPKIDLDPAQIDLLRSFIKNNLDDEVRAEITKIHRIAKRENKQPTNEFVLERLTLAFPNTPSLEKPVTFLNDKQKAIAHWKEYLGGVCPVKAQKRISDWLKVYKLYELKDAFETASKSLLTSDECIYRIPIIIGENKQKTENFDLNAALLKLQPDKNLINIIVSAAVSSGVSYHKIRELVLNSDNWQEFHTKLNNTKPDFII